MLGSDTFDAPCLVGSRRCDHRWPHLNHRNHYSRLPGLFAGNPSMSSLSQRGQRRPGLFRVGHAFHRRK